MPISIQHTGLESIGGKKWISQLAHDLLPFITGKVIYTCDGYYIRKLVLLLGLLLYINHTMNKCVDVNNESYIYYALFPYWFIFI